MIKPIFLACALAQCLLASSSIAGAAFYKCNINGATQYQQSPCQSNEDAKKPPTVEELNAERQKKLTQEKANPAVLKAPARTGVTPETFGNSPGNPPQVQRASFTCDGRIYCSQMTSCAEANYFLSNCPGVKMDGNHDGVPCQEQWCKR
jgi:hypothetical protein